MFLISAEFRPSRSEKCGEGAVFYRITGGKESGMSAKAERRINSGIKGADAGVLEEKKSKIVGGLRLLYCVIEHLEAKRPGYSIDDVAEHFRMALSGESSMAGVIATARLERALRSDLVSVGHKFRASFDYYYPVSATKPTDIGAFTAEKSLALKNEGKRSRAAAFISTMNSLKQFTHRDTLAFAEIDRNFIRRYSLWLERSGIADSTRSFYLRTLRSILNSAQAEGLMVVDPGWFTHLNPHTKSAQEERFGKALDRNSIAEIAQLPLSADPAKDLVRDMFMFGFYCRGMELVDIVNLTPDSVQGRELVYRRRLRGSLKRIPLPQQALDIIAKYKGASDTYLFPILDSLGRVQFATIRNAVSQDIKTIGRMVDCPELSFSMNIGSWNRLMSQITPADILLRKA